MSKEEILNLLPGDYIFREGEFGQHAYIINSGTVELVKFTGDQQSVLAELEKGALFGEMLSLMVAPEAHQLALKQSVS